MKTFAIVPVKRLETGKTRLASILNKGQRAALLHILLDQTVQSLSRCNTIAKIILVSGDQRAKEVASMYGAELLRQEEDLGVNSAVSLAEDYSIRAGAEATIIIPQDLPLLQPSDIDDACNRAAAGAEKRCVLICPALRYDGTNILLRRPPNLFPTYYDDNSYKNHIEGAKKAGVEPIVHLSENLMSDIDTPEDARQILSLARDGKRPAGKALRYLAETLRENYGV